jgi:hypothetical protein
MAMRGRMGDTELVHMSKPEIKGLASLGQLTINPDTGLPEAFKLKSILPTIAGIGAAFATGGTSLLVPAIATGLTSAVVNKDIGRGLFDGLLSYAGGSIMKGLAGGADFAGAAGITGETAGQTAAQTATQQAANTAANVASTQNLIGSGAGAGALPFNPVPAGGFTPIPASMVSGAANVPTGTMVSSFVPETALGKVGESVLYSPAAVGSIADPVRLASATYGTAQSTLPGLTAGETAKFFAPQAITGVGSAMLGDSMTPQQYQQPELISETVSTPRTPRTITRTPLRSTPVTEEEALAAALGTGPGLRFSDYTTRYANQGGLVGLAEGGRPFFEGMVPGDAHGMKDNVAFKVQGGNIDTAMLSPGEYVIPADVVAMLGNGNGDSGAKQLDVFAKGIRQKAFGTEKQQKQISAPKELGQLATA